MFFISSESCAFSSSENPPFAFSSAKISLAKEAMSLSVTIHESSFQRLPSDTSCSKSAFCSSSNLEKPMVDAFSDAEGAGAVTVTLAAFAPGLILHKPVYVAGLI